MAVYAVLAGLIVFGATAEIASGSVLGIWEVLLALGVPAWFSTGAVEFVTNVLLFLPLGFLGHTFRPRWGWPEWTYGGLAPACSSR